MERIASNNDPLKISVLAASLAIAASAAAFLFLASLHVLSPEFDPSWRMVSEYANGHYGWVLSLMFASWAVGSWALAFAIRSEAKTTAGKIGLVFLVAAGVGWAMGAAFDINHPLHDLAGFIGIGSLPIAAMLISVRLGRTQAWSAAKKALLWTANLTWISVVLLAATFIIMIASFVQAGGNMNAEATTVTALPPGVIAWVGWANRLLVVVYCAWVAMVAWQATKVRGQKSQPVIPEQS